MEIDWQINLTKIKDRGQYLLQSEKLADCRFLVGPSSNQSLIAGHRLLLAMASPVFECMFYGSLPEKDEPIIIPDVQPDAFEAILNYIYTDEFSISSFDNACDLYYVAKKYMLPHVVEHCTNFLVTNLSPNNTCRAYEFAKLYEEPRLIESSMQYIAINTRKVIADPSFMDIEVSTLMDILDQELLNIDSELDMFNCLLKFANERGLLNDGDKDNESDTGSENISGIIEKIKLEPEGSDSDVASTSTGTSSSAPNVADEVVVLDKSVSASGNAGESTADVNNLMEAQCNTIDEDILRQAVKKIRFLTMTPQQFVEGPARSNLLQQNEVLSILTNLVSPGIKDCSIPEGFCQSSKRGRTDRDHKDKPFFKWIETILNTRGNDFVYSNENICRLTFKVCTNIYLSGVQIELQRPCQEKDFTSFCACRLNMGESEIAYTRSIKKLGNLKFQFTFNYPIFLYRHQKYSITVINKDRYNIQNFIWFREKFCEDVKFSIEDLIPHYRDLGSAKYSIIFTTRN